MTSFLGFDYITPLSVASNQPELVTDTLSLRRVVGRTEAQRWECQITLQPDAFGSAGLVNAVQVHREVNGGHTAFTLPIPQPLNTAAVATTEIRASAARLAGNSAIVIDSTAPFSIPAGLFVTIAGGSKVYRVTTDVNFTPANLAAGESVTLNVFPAITRDVADNALVTVDNVLLTGRHNNNTGGLVSYTLAEGVVDRITLSIVEAL